LGKEQNHGERSTPESKNQANKTDKRGKAGVNLADMAEGEDHRKQGRNKNKRGGNGF